MFKKKFKILKKDYPIEIFFNTNKNSMYKLIDDNAYFESHFWQREAVDLEWLYLDLNKDLYKNMCSFIEEDISVASSLSEKPIEQRSSSIDEIKSIIFSSINYFANKIEEEEVSIFEFVTHIFIKCLTEHKFLIRNKRFNLAF